MIIENYLCGVLEALKERDVCGNGYTIDGNIIYFPLKFNLCKSIALKACIDSSEEYFWIFAEAVRTKGTCNGDESWIRGIIPESASFKPAVYLPQKGYGPLFENFFVWHEDVGSVVDKILETCGMGLASPEASQS